MAAIRAWRSTRHPLEPTGRGANRREFLRNLFYQRDSESAVAFALLGPNELKEALERWPQFRAEIIRIAHRSEVAPNITLPLLLDSAVGDNRRENSTPDHPLRVIDDHVAASDRPIEIRAAAIEVIDSWLRAGGDVGVGIRALAHVMRPQLRTAYGDPGLGNKLTLTEAPLPSEVVTALDPLWDQVLEIVEREKDGPVAPLIGALHSWVHPQNLSIGGASSEAAERAIRGVAPRVIERLGAILIDHPGALRVLRSYGAKFELEIAIPPEFEVLFPERWRGASAGYEDWWRSADAAVVALARHAMSRSLDDQIKLLHGSDVEAAAAGNTYPRFTPRLAQLLAESNTAPLTWIDVLVRHGAAADLLLPFLERSVEVDAEGWQDVLADLLGDESYSWVASQVVLTHPVGEELRAKGIARLTGQHQSLIEMLVLRSEVDAAAVEQLFDAADPIVARESAIAIAHAQGELQVSALSQAGQTRWREVIIASPPDEHWYSEILKREPELFSEWLCAWFARLESGSTDHWFLPRPLLEEIGGLPLRVRRELIDEIPANIPSFPLQDVATELVGSDLSVAEALLDRADLDDLHWVCLRRGPSECWMERALLALDRGWEPEQIVGATMSSKRAWSGEISQRWQEAINAFSRLDRKGDERRGQIIDAGIKVFGDLRDGAAEEEREERVFGSRHLRR